MSSQEPSCCFVLCRQDALSLAIEAGKEDIVRRLIGQDIKLLKRKTLAARMTPWHMAAFWGHASILKALVDLLLNSGEDTPTLLTSSLRRIVSGRSSPEQLLKVFLHQRSRGGITPLMLAARGGHTEAVAYLLSIGERKGGAQLECSSQVLSSFRILNHLLSFEPLCFISLGSDCWQYDSQGLTALHHAAIGGHVAVLTELLTNPPLPTRLASTQHSASCKCVVVQESRALDGSSVPITSICPPPPFHSYVQCVDMYGWSALHHACAHKQEASVSTLLGYDANLIARTFTQTDRTASDYYFLPSGVTPLHIAAAQGNLSMITLLLRAYVSSYARGKHAGMQLTA